MLLNSSETAMTRTAANRPTYNTILSDLVKDAGALTVLLVTRQGTMLANAGNTSYLNATAMAALVAGMFSATREVARIVGENQFSILLQQGEKRHIHISLVGEENMMVVVFEDQNRIGMIRLTARKVSERLAQAMAGPTEKERASGDISLPQFREYALDLIDQIFQP
jgi:predicted regulator of Ras-like GTPase activity (Roadblock/LC7/MglB family)